MKFLIGRKLQMTQLFNDEGTVCPVTAVSLESMKISNLRVKEKDGYEAVQVSYGQNDNRKEFKGDTNNYEKGKDIDLINVFDEGDVVNVVSKSKGKGFSGVVKRHGFAGGPRTHGQKHDERGGGSIGSGLRTRVPKGQKMAGRMGGDRVTIKGTRIVSIDKENNLILLNGSIPGRRGTLVEIRGV